MQSFEVRSCFIAAFVEKVKSLTFKRTDAGELRDNDTLIVDENDGDGGTNVNLSAFIDNHDLYYGWLEALKTNAIVGALVFTASVDAVINRPLSSDIVLASHFSYSLSAESAYGALVLLCFIFSAWAV